MENQVGLTLNLNNLFRILIYSILNKALLVKYLTRRFIGDYDPCYGKKLRSFRVCL